MTGLLPVPKDAINLVLDNFDGNGPAHGRYAGPVFSGAKLDFPSPTGAVSQLNDGVFNSSVFHEKAVNLSERRPLVGNINRPLLRPSVHL